MAGSEAAAQALRDELRDLHDRRRRGELGERDFQKGTTLRAVELYRSVVRRRLGKDEPILAEHHVVRGHFRFNQSILRETEQQAESLFLTPRRLVRLRSQLSTERPVSCDRQDGTAIDEVPLRRVRGLRLRRALRWGEALAGLTIIALALLFRSLLLVTGTALVVVRAAGLLHALLLPTRWVEVETAAGPIPVLAARRRSGRRLLRELRQLVEPARVR